MAVAVADRRVPDRLQKALSRLVDLEIGGLVFEKARPGAASY